MEEADQTGEEAHGRASPMAEQDLRGREKLECE